MTPKNMGIWVKMTSKTQKLCHDSYLNFKIHLHGYAARYAKNRIWGEEQKIVPDKKNPGPDGDGIILTFRSNQLYSIQRWTWQWASEAWPLEPKELVDDWLERRKRANELKPSRT